jgi:hypothetical protein
MRHACHLNRCDLDFGDAHLDKTVLFSDISLPLRLSTAGERVWTGDSIVNLFWQSL